MQLSHAVLPEAPINLPTAHRVHISVPLLAAIEPGKHSLHTLGSELPGIGLALPGAHAMQEVLLNAPSLGL